MDFTEEQKRIFNFVRFEENNGIIDAVAGSGKTTTIIESAGFIDKSRSVLFCAFNRSIKKEIQTRFEEKGLSHIVVKTMHALGYDILKSVNRTDYQFDNYKYNKLIERYVKEQAEHSLEPLLHLNRIAAQPNDKREAYQLKRFTTQYKDLLLEMLNKFRLTLCKDNFEQFEEMVLHFNLFETGKTKKKTFSIELAHYYDAVKFLIKQGNALAEKQMLIDFADMLYLPFALELYPEQKFDLLFIDECQDLSNAQIAVALKYLKKSGRLLAVGDPSQSIYGFAGADIASYRKLGAIPNTVELSLSTCFRCPDDVIELARNFRGDIYPHVSKAGEVYKIPFEILNEKVKPGDLVIARIKEPLLECMLMLLDQGRPVEVHEDDIKEVLNSLRFIFSREELKRSELEPILDDVRSRNHYFIDKEAKEIPDQYERELFVKQQRQLLESKLQLLLKQSKMHLDVDDIDGLLKKLKQLISGNADAIKLSTIHKAKGLENEVVFILGYDKLPLYRDGQQEWEKEQERNLKYVALTRAKEKLYLVDTKKVEPNEKEASFFDTYDLF